MRLMEKRLWLNKIVFFALDIIESFCLIHQEKSKYLLFENPIIY